MFLENDTWPGVHVTLKKGRETLENIFESYYFDPWFTAIFLMEHAV
nr:hypothetical protein [Candidatus Sigynarchaeota archaeon]